MSIKSGFVRCLLLSLMVLFVGCASQLVIVLTLKAMTQKVEVLQKENKNFDNRLALSEQEKVELVEELDRLADEGRNMEERLSNMEERLNGLREENSLMTQRIEKIAMTQKVEVLQKENKNFDNRLALSEQEKVELVEELDRSADEGRNMEERLSNMEERLNGLREENSLMTQRIEKIAMTQKVILHEVVESQRPRVELLGEIAK